VTSQIANYKNQFAYFNIYMYIYSDMCLAIPGKVIEIEGTEALVDIMGNRTKANISVLDNVKQGDYILVHAGFGIQKYDDKTAEENLGLIKDLINTQEK
jgi:hydrogenase expression/formation protein HypC